MYKSTTGTGRSFEVGEILPSLELETNLNLPDAVGLWGDWWDVWVGDGVGLYRLVESQTQSLQPGDWYFAGRVRAAPAPAYGSECVWPAVAQQVQPTQLSFFKCDESNQHSVQVRVANMLTSKHIQEPLKSTEQACSLQQ